MSDDRRKTYTRRGALGLMGAGGVFTVTETFGVTRLTADRGVEVSVGSDADAGLKIYPTGDEGSVEEYTFSDPAKIEFENTTSSTDITTISCDFKDNSSNVEFGGDDDFSGDDYDGTLSPDESVILTIENTSNDEDGKGGSTQKPTLSITAEFENGITIKNLKRTISIEPN